MRLPLTWFGLIVGLVGLAIDFWVIIPAGGTPASSTLAGSLVSFWTYFTHLTNLALVLIYLSELTDWRWLNWFSEAGTRGMMVAYIGLVMGFYHFMLAPYLHMEGALLVATILLHYVAPTAYIVWWALVARHGALTFRIIPALLLPGLLYIGWVLLRGLVVQEYPYDILDAGKFGYGAVAIGSLVLLVVVSLLCALTVGADRLLARRAGLRSAAPSGS